MAKKEMTYQERVNNKIAYYRTLPTYKNLPEHEIVKAAEDSIKLYLLIRDLEIEEQFSDIDEQSKAEELAIKYFKDYAFEFISEKNTLKQLIFLEIINYRLQKSLNEFYKDAGSGAPPQMLESLHRNLMQIIELKKILGLAKSDKAQDTNVNPIELLKRKFRVWRNNNQASRTLVCPHCAKMIMLKIRTDAWEALKHPFFKDRILGNAHLIKMYKDKTITKEDVAKVLTTSPDYTDWLVNRWERNIQQVKTEDTPTEKPVSTDKPAKITKEEETALLDKMSPIERMEYFDKKKADKELNKKCTTNSKQEEVVDKQEEV